MCIGGEKSNILLKSQFLSRFFIISLNESLLYLASYNYFRDTVTMTIIKNIKQVCFIVQKLFIQRVCMYFNKTCFNLHLQFLRAFNLFLFT